MDQPRAVAFADDVVFTSPVAVRLFPASGGVIRGEDRCEVLTFGGGLVRTGPGTSFAASG
jgi:hypothetical protein